MATWEELTYALRYKKAIFCIKMCKVFKQPRIRGLLDNMQVSMWMPDTDLDPALVESVAAMLQKMNSGREL